MVSLRDILIAVENIDGMLRTLDGVEPLYRDDEVEYYVGNLSISFKVLLHGEPSLMKCYSAPNRYIESIYGERYHPRELLVFKIDNSSEWVDVVIDRWREGETLLSTLKSCYTQGSHERIPTLSHNFDTLALSLLSSEWAHGDLTLENIIVSHDDSLHLIDFDAVYLPEFCGESSCEIGTDAFQHPERGTKAFNRDIDDYSIALISTVLHLLSTSPELMSEFLVEDEFILRPCDIIYGRCNIYQRVLESFALEGRAIDFRIAALLTSPCYQLSELKDYLHYALSERVESGGEESFARNGAWGFLTPTGDEAIPAIYSCAFDFSCSVAAVQVGRYWHYINTKGEIVLNCSDCEAIKPALNGEFRLLRKGEWCNIVISD